MKKIVINILLPMMLILSFCCSCGRNDIKGTEKKSKLDTTYNIPEISSDYFKVYAEDSKFSYSEYSVCNTMLFTMLSGKPIDEEKLEVTINGGIEYDYSIVEDDEEVMPEWILEIYNKNVDANILDSEYALIADELPKVYQYILSIEPKNYTSGKVNELTVKYEGVEYKYNIDVDYVKLDMALDDKERLSCETVARTDLNAEYFVDGTVDIENLKFSVNDDIELEDIYFAGCDSTIIDEIRIVSDGMDYIWDKTETNSFGKEDEFTISVLCHDEMMKKMLSCNRYLVFKYLYNGKEYETYVEIQCRIRLDGYEMFALDDNSVDYKTEYIKRYSR